MILEGRRIVVTGVINRRSIAFRVAERAQEEGAEVVLTSFGRLRRMTERAAKRLANPPDVLELDIDSDDDLAALATELASRWGRVDGVVHAIAFSPPDAIGDNFLGAPRESASKAFETSAFSLKALAAALRPLMTEGHPSVVGLDFDATVAWPSYDWMGVAKAALESTARYLARDLGPDGIRVNLVAAGPLRTAAASGITGFGELSEAWGRAAPLGWDPADPGAVADAVLFCLSDLSRAVSGEIIHVDGGFHAIGAPGAELLSGGD